MRTNRVFTKCTDYLGLYVIKTYVTNVRKDKTMQSQLHTTV